MTTFIFQAVKIDDLGKVTKNKLLDIAGVSEAKYHVALKNAEKKTTVLYKRRSCEMNIVSHNTVILQLLKSNANIQFVNVIFAILTYLTSSLYKPEHTVSQLTRKTSKESYGRNIWEKLSATGNAFITKREASIYKTIIPVLSIFAAENLEYCCNLNSYVPPTPSSPKSNKNAEKFAVIGNYDSWKLCIKHT